MYLFRKNGVNVENISLKIFCYHDTLSIRINQYAFNDTCLRQHLLFKIAILKRSKQLRELAQCYISISKYDDVTFF